MNAKLKSDLARIAAFVRTRSTALPVDQILVVMDAPCIDDLSDQIVEEAFAQWSAISRAAERQRAYATVERACWRIDAYFTNTVLS